MISGRQRVTGIFKEPVPGKVAVAGVSVGADVQMDKKHHGGTFKAVYVYAQEDYDWWAAELDRELSSGMFGENLTTSGVDVNGGRIGEMWRAGSALIEVTAPRLPCSTLATRMGIKGFVKRFAQAERFGAYCRIVEAGVVSAGNDFLSERQPDHGVTIVDVARALYSGDPEEGQRIYEETGRPEHFAGWAQASGH